MSDLQDELNEIGSTLNHWPAIVEAARRVANLDYEAFHKALYEWYHSERPMSPDVEKELLDAALGITEDTHELGEAGMLTENQHRMKDNDLRAPGPIRELSEILDVNTEDE